MALSVAQFVVAVCGVWVALGAAFAIAFTSVGIGRVDPEARAASVGFRLLVFPATVALWPLLLVRWVRGKGEPPEERTAHRRAKRGPIP